MIKNFLIITWRNLINHKAFSAINILGLSLSMSVCLLLILFIKDAYQYDTFHQDGNRIYRINTEAQRKGGGKEPYASNPYPVAEALIKNYPGIAAWAPLNHGMNAETKSKGSAISVHFYFTTKSFFDVFNFSMKEGNTATALEEPNSILLTQKLADKLFPKGDALGQTLEFTGVGLFKVNGIMNPPISKTHLDFEALVSLSTVPALELNQSLRANLHNWLDYYQNYNYIKLQPGTDVETIEQALAQISADNYKDRTLESRDEGYRFFLQPLSEMNPGPMLSNSMGVSLPKIFLFILSILIGIIMLAAIFNYASLTIARSANRLKEIAMRKVVGSNNRSIFNQMILESIMVSLLSFILSIGFLYVLIKRVSTIAFIQQININFILDRISIIAFVIFALIVGVIGGLLPALVLSKIKPVSLFQKLQNTSLFKHIGLRNGLLGFQILLCLIFVPR